MKLRKGPRPWVVHAFALFLLVQGLSNLLTTLPAYRAWEENERLVIGAFAWSTIVLIPIIAIWCFASRIARMVVTIFAAPALLFALWQAYSAFGAGPFKPGMLVLSLATPFAVALLYHPSAREWFQEKPRNRDEVDDAANA